MAPLQWEIQAVGHVGHGCAHNYDPINRYILESINAHPSGQRR
jgi:hypothetical protein